MSNEVMVFTTKARQLAPKTMVHDVLLNGKVIATCSNQPAADAVSVALEQRRITSLSAFKELPNSFKNTFLAVTSMASPQF